MEENMNLEPGVLYDFMDFVGVGAQYDDDYKSSPIEQEIDAAPKNMCLVSGSQLSFIDFMGLGAQHGDDIDVDDLLPQVHYQQRDSTCSDVNNALVKEIVYSPMELLLTAKLEPNSPEDGAVRLDLELRLLPAGEFAAGVRISVATAAVHPMALDLCLGVTRPEGWAAWADITKPFIA